MIPRWQIIGCLILVLIAAAAVHGSPGSYAYAFFTGKCWKISSPACDPGWTRDSVRGHAPGWR